MDLINWKARRAGGRITITGTDAMSGEPAKIVGVDVIEPHNRSGNCIATDKSGARHMLFTAAGLTAGLAVRKDQPSTYRDGI